MSGFDSETATAPTDELAIWPSVTGAHFAPPSVVFQRPPPTAPKYASLGRPFAPDTAIDRPPRSGPTLRHLKEVVRAGSSTLSEVDVWAESSGRTTPFQPADRARAAPQTRNERILGKPIMAGASWAKKEMSLAQLLIPLPFRALTPPSGLADICYRTGMASRPRYSHPILFGTLVVGTLDLLDAVVFFRIRNGVPPLRIFQSIAAGLLGR